MQRLSDNHLAAEYTGGFQTTHRYSAAHSARWRRTETCNLYIYSVGLVFMPGPNSIAAVFQPIVIWTLCSNNNRKPFVLFFKKNKLNYLWQILKLFPTQRIDNLLFRAAPDNTYHTEVSWKTLNSLAKS